MAENVSIYFADGDESQLLERFDEVAVGDDGKRSEKIRHAMELYLSVTEATERADWAATSEQELQRSLRMLILSES